MIRRSTLVIGFALSGCATLAPPEERQVQFIENVSASKAEAFSRALAYFGKAFGDAHKAIKVQNADAGQIVAKGNYPCSIFRQTGDFSNYSVHFDLDFQAKDKRIRLAFEDMRMVDGNSDPVAWDYGQIDSREKAARVGRECLVSLKSSLLKAIDGGNW
mgnify:CR=1 FL=1